MSETGMENLSLRTPLLYAAWVMALAGTVGSLFFSEVMLYPPCVLCWYQRIALYPLVVIIGMGIATQDRSAVKYALPLCLIGLLIAVYHNLLYYGFIPESITPCTEGVPCNAKQVELLGFITIPMMALAGFAGIAACLALAVPKRRNL
jgi:disulfide bond formation protein DsbB